uniref:Transcription initiation factor IIA subunit 1 n=1 Tax=Clastoptera arizonana TaxID=38151 RepID=A0A1B6DRZ6_9HEMI
MSLSQNSVIKLYTSVIEDVISGVRDAFIDEGVDEQVLQELKQIWESKIVTSKALEVNSDPPEPQPPLKDINRGIGKLGTSSINATYGGQIVNNHTQAGQPVTNTQTVQDFTKVVPIQITLPQQNAPNAPPRVLTIHVPPSALEGNVLHSVLTGPVIAATMALPVHLASSLLQSHVTASLQGQSSSAPIHVPNASHNVAHLNNTDNSVQNRQPFNHQNQVTQLDGHHDTSDDEEEDEEEENDDDDDEEDIDDKEDDEEAENDGGAEEEPLNSGDDVSEEDPTDLFDTDNVVVCQYDKITRSRNKWKFHLKDGIMNLSGKDFVFQKANGDAEW